MIESFDIRIKKVMVNTLNELTVFYHLKNFKLSLLLAILFFYQA